VGINRTSGYNSSQRLGVLSGISNIGTNGSLCGPGVGLKARRPSISQAYIQPSVISLITTPLRRVGGGGRKIPESTVANSGSSLHSVIRSPSRDRLFDSTRRLMTGGRLSPGVSVGAPPRVESLSSSAVGLAASATSWAE
jgi:cysteine synthase